MIEKKDWALPWKMIPDIREERDKYTGAVEEYCAGYDIHDANNDQIVGCEGITDGSDERASFLVNSVNAVPELIAALRDAAEKTDMDYLRQRWTSLLDGLKL